MPIFVDVLEQVLNKCEGSLFDGERTGVRLALPFPHGGSEILQTTEEKILFVVEVRVECRAAYIRTIDDVLHRQRLEAFFLDQGKEGAPKQLMRPLHPPIFSLRHPA